MSSFTAPPPSHFQMIAEAPARLAAQEPPQKRSFANVGPVERAIAAAAGAGLIAYALFRRTTPSLIVGLGTGTILLARSATGYCPLYHALGIDNAHPSAAPHDYYEKGIHVEARYTVARPPEELYAFWRNFENLPKFMHHLKAVICKGPRQSHWVARGPLGFEVEWDAEIINDEPNHLIAWHTIGDADVDSAGTVRFLPAPDGRGTIVHVNLDYIPPAGKVGHIIAKLFGDDPKRMIEEDLRRFKQLMETGEIPTTAGQPTGTCR